MICLLLVITPCGILCKSTDYFMADIYYKLDRNSRADLMATVRRAAIEILEGPQEEWITADEVSKRFPFFNKEWMKKYGYLLPRKRVEVMDKKGSITKSHWYYSRNKILRMVRDNDILRFEELIDRD